MLRRRTLSAVVLETLFALPTDQDLLMRHYSLGADDLVAIDRRRGEHNRLGFALQLCALRFPGRVIRPGETVPLAVLRFLAEQLDIDPAALGRYAERAPTRYEHLDTLRSLYGFRSCTRRHREELATWATAVALTTTKPGDVAEAVMAELRRRALAAPGPTVIERLVATAMTGAEREVEQHIAAALTEAQARALDTLLDVAPGERFSPLGMARESTGAVTARTLDRLIERRISIEDLGLASDLLKGVHESRVRLLAGQGLRLSAHHLRSLRLRRRRAVLAATAVALHMRLTDAIIGLFDRLIGRLFRCAERRSAARREREARATNDALGRLAAVGGALIAARAEETDPFAAVEAVLPWADLEALVAASRALVRPDGPDYAEIATTSHAFLRRIGPAFLDAVTFDGAKSAVPLLKAIDAMRTFYRGPRRKLPADLPRGFISARWREAVVRATTRNGAIDGPAYELCLFATLRDRLRAGDIWVQGSRQYRAVEDQLLPKPMVAAMKEAGPLPVAVPDDAVTWLAEREAILTSRLATVEAKAAADILEDVHVANGALKIAPLGSGVPAEAEALADRLYARLPRVRITRLLQEVADWTGVLDDFVHLRTERPPEASRVALTAILADATNLGLMRMAEACPIVTHRQLAWTADWHLREETYDTGLARLAAAQQGLPLARAFGSGIASSSDGQHFPLSGAGEVLGAVNPHKNAVPAIGFYTHVSDRYAPFHVRTISVSESEAPHVVDGLLRSGEITSAVHHVDGGEVSDHVFGLLALLGYRFAPRIPNLHDRRLYTFGAAATWPTLAPFVSGRVDAGLIATHWDDLLRLAISVRTGTVSAAVVLKRLAAYPRQNALALALREVGRLERTLFTLDWLEDPALRRQATVELNKGEARNALARAVCFHRLGRVRDRSLEGLQHRAGGLTFVTAAIILWNTVYLERAIAQLRSEDETVPDALLAY
ncbi:MAG: Tn3 family transposase, partial [Pseudomonadota bacterium]